MNKKILNFKKLIDDISHVSRKTEVNKKKLRLFISVVLTNITVFIDIGVIVIFSEVITGTTNTTNKYLDFIIENIYLLPFIVIVRFIAIYIEKMNIQSLMLQVQENLKMYLIKEVYKKGNFSLADVNFYTGTLSTHISYFYGALANGVNNLLQLIAYSSFLIYSDPSTISIFGIGAVVLFFPTRKLLAIGRKYMHVSYELSQKNSRNTQRIVDNIFLIKILKTSEYEFKYFQDNLKKLFSSQLNNHKFGAINSLLPNFATLFIFSLLVAFFDLGKKLTLEFIAVTLRIVQTVGTLNTSLNALINSQVHIEKFRLLEDEIPHIREDYYITDDSMTHHAVDIKNVTFEYFGSETEIFKKLNLQINKNQHTIITGPNGSGKSTLLGLISGVFYPQKGDIILSSKKFGYVGVTPLIISGSLRDNLIYGNNEKPTDQKMNDLIEEFKLFNESDPISLDYEINNKSLSSGQMQKISFIRSLLANVDILLLDESTSNLDKETKKLIFEILNNKNLTIINSTHNGEDFDYDKHLKIELIDDKRQFTYVK
tara:strand:+ start:1663 stop:3285 length:1623 start_codon:yes stop_codon:yes gene_type:complete